MRKKVVQSKVQLTRGAWTESEDGILRDYVTLHGEGKWNKIPKETGIKRCGKSCRLRWLKYLRPDIKRGNITDDEKDLIIRLHKLLGNRWSLIAGRLPGRTDNEIKNYWNTYIAKKIQTNHNYRRSIIPNKTGSDSSILTTTSSLSSRCDDTTLRDQVMNCNIEQFSNIFEDQLPVEPSRSSRSSSLGDEIDNKNNDNKLDNDLSPMSDALSMMNNELFLDISQELRFELEAGSCDQMNNINNGGFGSSSYDPLMFWDELETMFD